MISNKRIKDDLMCDLCRRLQEDKDFSARISDLYNKINERLKATKREPVGGEVAFSTMPFPLLTTALFEPRMPLQLPSNFFQPMSVDGQKLRSDWASGWTRAIAFMNGSLFLLAHGVRTKEAKEYLLYLHMVEFKKGEYSITTDGNKITISVNNVTKEGIDLINDKNTQHTYSFSFVHQPTERAMVPRDRIEHSSLVQTVYHGKLPQKPLAFDWTTYVVTVPHLAPHPFIHQKYKELGYVNAMEMQNVVTELLKAHISL
jgi:hypothetical protein